MICIRNGENYKKKPVFSAYSVLLLVGKLHFDGDRWILVCGIFTYHIETFSG